MSDLMPGADERIEPGAAGRCTFAARLLILREFLHHLALQVGFRGRQLREKPLHSGASSAVKSARLRVGCARQMIRIRSTMFKPWV